MIKEFCNLTEQEARLATTNPKWSPCEKSVISIDAFTDIDEKRMLQSD